MDTTIICSVCGTVFNPADHPSCGTCPLQKGCHMVCCPGCGASHIDPTQSRLARWVQSIFGEKQHATISAQDL